MYRRRCGKRSDLLLRRNVDKFELVVAIFDRDGQIVEVRQKSVELHLRDATLQRLAHLGLATKMQFDVKPGSYQVRVVVREGDSAQLTAMSRFVEIPY